ADLFAAASRAWWNWAIAGQRLGNYASQLRLAEDRARMLEEEVRSGAVPAIDLVDDQRLVLSRRAALSLGELSLTRSAFAVSNFYRDNDGDPIKVSHENLPRELGGDLTWDQTYGDSMRMLQESPALAARRLTLEILNEEIHLAKNGLLPRL